MTARQHKDWGEKQDFVTDNIEKQKRFLEMTSLGKGNRDPLLSKLRRQETRALDATAPTPPIGSSAGRV